MIKSTRTQQKSPAPKEARKGVAKRTTVWFTAVAMAKKCVVTGKVSQVGGGYSNRVRATQFNPTGKTRRKANIHRVRVFVPELERFVVANLSAKALRTIAKRGAFAVLKEAGVIKPAASRLAKRISNAQA